MRILLIVLALAGSARAEEPAFDSYWHDGKAELDGYQLTVERYGHSRTGRAVLIYVTEPFSETRHVKIESMGKLPADGVDAFKLNLVRDFQTGIYDYHTMVSLFVRSSDFSAMKLAFTSSEWCGQVYEELNVRDRSIDDRLASYFEGESREEKQALPDGALGEDELFVRLRGLRGDFLRAGERRALPLAASSFFRRLAHRPLAYQPATIERRAKSEIVRVPAGAIKSIVYVVKTADGRTGRFDVEEAPPHRLVRWAWTPATGAPALGGTDAGELTGSARLEYWRLHDPGDERELEKLGLAKH